MIPKIVHQIWIGPHDIPDNCLFYIDTVKKNHLDYEYILWTNSNLPKLPDLVNQQYMRYGKLKKYAFQADILRYFLINYYGGIYLDIDFEVFKNLTPVIKKPFTITIPHAKPKNIHWIANSMFASVPNNSILTSLLNTLKNEIYHGPIFFASKIKKFLHLPIDKSVSALDIFNACENNNFIKCLEYKIIFQEYCKHHALKSWL